VDAWFWEPILGQRGIAVGDRVLLWGHNSAEWVACFWGILLRGAIVVPMDAAASIDFVRRVIQDAGVKLILRDDSLPELSGSPPSLIINNLNDVYGAAAEPLIKSREPGRASTRSTIAEILYTSGTTAEP